MFKSDTDDKIYAFIYLNNRILIWMYYNAARKYIKSEFTANVNMRHVFVYSCLSKIIEEYDDLV